MTEKMEALLAQIAGNTNATHIFSRYLASRTLYQFNARTQPFTNPFNRFGKKMFSQTDEDGLSYEIIKRLGIEKGVFAEFGVGNGTENNTLSLVGLKWRGFWVGNEDLAINTNPSGEPQPNFVYQKDFVTLDNVVGLVASGLAAIGQERLDFMSLDLDGNDLHLVKAVLAAGYQPSVFVVEYNAKFLPPAEFVIDYNPEHWWDHTDYMGASLTSYVKLFEAHDYFLVCCNSFNGANAFFVKRQHRDLFPEVPDDLEQLWNPPMYFLPPDYGHPTSPRTLELLFRNLQQDR